MGGGGEAHEAGNHFTLVNGMPLQRGHGGRAPTAGMDVTASQAKTPSPFGAGSRHQPPPPTSTNASVSSLAPAGPSPFGADRHQAAQQAAIKG